MKIVLKPSLEHMALVKIVISLWNQNDVKDLIIKHSSENLFLKNNWETIEEKVIAKVSQLSLPTLLKEKVLSFIRPIGLEISMWIEYNYKYLPAYPQAKLCWTPQGTVDRKGTAEVLVTDKNLDISIRYKIACDYCLESDIIRLWRCLPKNVKDYDWKNLSVIRFWSDKMKRGVAGNFSYQKVFYRSAHEGNKEAAKYFLQKLTPQEREKCLRVLPKYIDDADILCFLLPETEQEEQIKALKKIPHRVLHFFLQWPWQRFFVGVANCMWEFLSKNNYEEILGDIIGKVSDGCKDYNYQKLFGEFWQKSPSVLKDSFIDEIDKSWILQSLFDIKDKENIRLILKDTSFTEKERLIYSDEIKDFLTRFVWANEWDFLEFCVRECLPSKDEMLKFKEEFENRISPHTKKHLAKNKDKWSKIFCFSDDSICK